MAAKDEIKDLQDENASLRREIEKLTASPQVTSIALKARNIGPQWLHKRVARSRTMAVDGKKLQVRAKPDQNAVMIISAEDGEGVLVPWIDVACLTFAL